MLDFASAEYRPGLFSCRIRRRWPWPWLPTSPCAAGPARCWALRLTGPGWPGAWPGMTLATMAPPRYECGDMLTPAPAVAAAGASS